MRALGLIGVLCLFANAAGLRATLVRTLGKVNLGINPCRQQSSPVSVSGNAANVRKCLHPPGLVSIQRDLRPDSSVIWPNSLNLRLFKPAFKGSKSKVVPKRRRHRHRSGIIVSDGEEELTHSAAAMLPLLGRLFGQAANLFQVGALFGTIPTLLAGLVCSYWAWQVLVAGSRDYQSRKTAEGIKACRLPAPKIGPGRLGFVDRAKLLNADALREEVGSRYNPTILVYGERGSGKTVAVQLALHGVWSVIRVKLWAQDLDRPLKALAQAIVDASGADVTLAPTLVAEAAFRRLKAAGSLSPIVVIELDKRCTAPQLMGVLLAAKRWGDDENLAKFVVEAPSARIARGLPISLSDMRVEGLKVHPLARKEALQVARGCVPLESTRDWRGGRPEDLAKYVVTRVGCGMLDLVRVGFAARNARDPLAFHAVVDSFATREARAARGGVTAFVAALNLGAISGEPKDPEKRLWRAIKGAAAWYEGRQGRNPGLDEVLDELGVSEGDFERAAGGAGPVCPVAVDPFSYKVAVRSAFFRDALAAVGAVSKDEDGAKCLEVHPQEEESITPVVQKLAVGDTSAVGMMQR